MQAKTTSFETRIVAILAIVFVLVTLIGIFTFNSLHGIVSEAKEATKPNTKIDLLKQVVTDLTDAESSMKSYRITGDESYLSPFFESISLIDTRIDALQQQSSGEAYLENLADSVGQLVQIKYAILNQFLKLEENPRVNEELKKLSEQLNTTETLRSLKIDKRPSIFQNIFGSTKQNDSVINGFVFKNFVPQRLPSDGLKQIEQIDLLKQKELYLTHEDRLIMDKIRSIIKKMENFERTSNARKAINISKSAKQTNFYIIIFCVLATVLLGFSSFFIVTFMQKNRAYRNALRNAKTQAENLARAKESFLANMSHEIRTPLNAIAGFTNQVLQSELTPKQGEQLNIVKKSSDHLLQIINDILDYSKIQSGKFKFEEVGFKPAELVRDTALLMQPSASAKGLRIHTAIAPTVPEICIGDPVRLRQIVLNLVANAIKFTESGKITIRISAVPQSNTQVALRLSVEDTGAGIPEDKLRTIFNEFEQADTSVSRKFGGTGLGLTISKRLAELQNGSIGISSKLGEGTKVNIIIPYTVGAEKDLEEGDAEISETNLLEGVEVLVADDEEYNRLLIKTILKKWGVNITVVKNGKEAVEAAEANQYDVVLMDVLMPVMSGIEATEAIKKTPKNKDLPVIALTAATRQEKIEECKAAGMTNVLPKPFNENELYRLLVATTQEKPEPPKETLMQKQETESNKPYNLEELKSLANGDNDFVVEMATVFINTTKEGLRDMEEALAEENWESLADYAHKIVPPCRHMQANTLLKKLKHIEAEIRDHNRTDNMGALVAEAKQEAQQIITQLEAELQNL